MLNIDLMYKSATPMQMHKGLQPGTKKKNSIFNNRRQGLQPLTGWLT